MRGSIKLAKLQKLPLFEGVADEKLLELTGHFHCKDFPAKTAIITHGQPGTAVYIILEGSVRIVVDGNEREIILAVLGPGEVIGEMCVLGEAEYSATAVTRERSELLWMTHDTFVEHLWKVDPVPFNMARILSQRLRATSMRLQAIIAFNVSGRVANQLLTYAQEFGKVDKKGGILIPIRLTQADLADIVGASRVRVNQILAEWKQHKYIAMDSDHHITVLDKKALMRCTW